VPTIKPGWSLSPTGLQRFGHGLDVQNVSLFDELALPQNRSLFRCAADGDVCNGKNDTEAIANRTSAVRQMMRRRLAPDEAAQSVNNQCTEGHSGALCAVCMAGWTGKFQQACTPCPESDYGAFAPMAGLVVGTIVVIMMYRTCKRKLRGAQVRVDTLRERYAVIQRAHQKACQIRGELQDATTSDDSTAFQPLMDMVKIIVGNRARV
jgi:hypothetical protein